MKTSIFTILKIERFKYMKQLSIFTILKMYIPSKVISIILKDGGFGIKCSSKTW